MALCVIISRNKSSGDTSVLQDHYNQQVELATLTCDSDVSVCLSFINDIHHLLRTRHKTLSTSLMGNRKHVTIILLLLWYQCGSYMHRSVRVELRYLYIGNPVFVLVNSQVGLRHWNTKCWSGDHQLSEVWFPQKSKFLLLVWKHFTCLNSFLKLVIDWDLWLVYSIQLWVNILPRGKCISIGLREAIVAVHHSAKWTKSISKLFGNRCSAMGEIVQRWKIFKTVVNILRSGCPRNFTPSSNDAMLREMRKNKGHQNLQTSLSMLNVEVHDSTIRRRLKKYKLFGRIAWRKPSSIHPSIYTYPSSGCGASLRREAPPKLF